MGLKWYITVLCIYTTLITVESVIPDYLIRARPTPRPQSLFTPSRSRCCRVGERTARDIITCNVEMYTGPRQNNIQRTSFRRNLDSFLIHKIQRCFSEFSAVFQRCCEHKADFYKDLRMCNIIHRRREDRHSCRAMVRQEYESS